MCFLTSVGVQAKGKNGINERQDKIEGNMVSLSQHGCYGSVLHDYTCITYIKLLAFSVVSGGEEGREKSLNFFYM